MNGQTIQMQLRKFGADSNECLPLKERCAEALALSEAAADPDMDRKHAELQDAMTSAERLIQAVFLGG